MGACQIEILHWGEKQNNMRRHLAEIMIQRKLGNEHDSFVEFLQLAHDCSTSAYPEGDGVSIGPDGL